MSPPQHNMFPWLEPGRPGTSAARRLFRRCSRHASAKGLHLWGAAVRHSKASEDCEVQEADLCAGSQNVLCELHHVVVVSIGLVELNGGELRIMAGGGALISEDAPNLKHLFKAAHYEALEVQLSVWEGVGEVNCQMWDAG